MEEKTKEKKSIKKDYVCATCKRKTSIARVFLYSGTGNITVNDKEYKDYFQNFRNVALILEKPFEITNTKGKYDIYITVKGGGFSSQVGAARHGISRALIKANENLRKSLKVEGMLTRDSRIKERKKYGRRRARRGHQFKKR